MAAAVHSTCPVARSRRRRCFRVVSYRKMTEMVVEVSSSSYCCYRNFVAEDSLRWGKTVDEVMVGVGM